MNTFELQKKSAFDIADYSQSEKSIFSQAKTNFEVLSQNNVITAKGFSDGGLNANIPIIKDALGQWVKQAQVQLSLSELNSLAALVALKLHSAKFQPGSKESLDLKKAADTLSNRLLPLGTQLSYKQFGDEKLKKPSVNSGATLSTLRKDIVNGIADSDAWQKKLQTNIEKVPGWNEAPSETVEKYTMYCLNMVKLLNMCGPCSKKYDPSEQSEMIEKFKETCELNLKEVTADLNKWIYQSQTAFPWEKLEKPEVQLAASNMFGNSFDQMLAEFSIRLISDGAMAGQGAQKEYHTGKYIGVQLTPVSDYKKGQGKDDSYMCIISAAQQNQAAKNGVTSFGGITNPSTKQSLDPIFMGPEDPATYYQSAYGIGPLAPGAHGGWFRWGMGNYGGLYRAMLILSEKLVNDFESYCNGINADKFDMKAAAEFQVKTMQFVTTFGAIMKALSGALKQAKAVVDAVQA